jgi:peptide/nickel transport system substrate-binding protein
MRLDRRSFLAASLCFAASQAFAQKSANELVAAFPRPVRTLDGNYADLRENDILGLLVDDALFAIDPNSGAPVPLAAESHEFSDERTLRIKLRDDVLFHDGTKLNAEDVFYTYKHLLDPKTQNNFQDRFARWLEGVEAEDARTVVFRMKVPYAMALHDLAMYSKLRKAGVYTDPSRREGINPEAQALQLNGTGPYRVVSFRPGQDIVLERFKEYRSGSPKSPAIQKITIRIIPDWATQAAEVISGGVH